MPKAAAVTNATSLTHRRGGFDLQQCLKQYAAAAVGLAAASPLAMAQAPGNHIVFTAADISFYTSPRGQTIIPIDFNNDGVTDIKIAATGVTFGLSGHGGGNYAVLVEFPAAGNFALGGRALPFGAPLDAGVGFRGQGQQLAFADFFVSSLRESSSSVGPFRNVTNKYLGVKFAINGKLHEGWIRFTVACSQGNIRGTITGYAYDTVAGEHIKAGDLQGPSAAEMQVPVEDAPKGALGMLALGASGLPYWRR